VRRLARDKENRVALFQESGLVSSLLFVVEGREGVDGS